MADYSVDVNNHGTVGADVTIEGLDDISVDSTVTVKPLSSTVTLEPLTTTSTITLEPTTSNVSTSSSVDFDLEPVTVDSCVRVELGPLPPTRVRSPWEQRVGMTVFGIEVLGLTWCGEAETYVEPAPRRPLIAGVVDQHHEEPNTHDAHKHHENDERGHRQGAGQRSGQGIVVRVRP
jgi:hypothetical protein